MKKDFSLFWNPFFYEVILIVDTLIGYLSFMIFLIKKNPQSTDRSVLCRKRYVRLWSFRRIEKIHRCQ